MATLVCHRLGMGCFSHYPHIANWCSCKQRYPYIMTLMNFRRSSLLILPTWRHDACVTHFGHEFGRELVVYHSEHRRNIQRKIAISKVFSEVYIMPAYCCAPRCTNNQQTRKSLSFYRISTMLSDGEDGNRKDWQPSVYQRLCSD